MELLKFTTTTSTEDDNSSFLKRSDDNSFPRRERTPSGHIDPKGAFRFTPRLSRHLASKKSNSSLRIISLDSNNNHTTSDNSNKNSKTADISTMASSYSSAKLAPPISSATVDGFEFRRDQQLWFIIQVHPCPMTIPGSESQPIPRKPYSIYRRYKDVVDFVERLEKEFPWLKAYQQDSQNNALPSFREKDPTWSPNRTRDGTTLFDPHRSQRKDELDRYLQTLFTLESIVIQCRLVSEFFGIWKTDLQFHLNQKDQDPLALHSVSPTASASSKSLAADPRTGSDTSLSSFPWSPDLMSLPTSVDSSPALSPTLLPSQGKKRGCFLWDVPPNLSDLSAAINHRNFTPSSMPGSSSHNSDDSEDDASDHTSGSYSDTSEETDTHSAITNKFPGPPYIALQKTTSMQTLEEMLERVLGPLTSSAPSSSSSPHLPPPRTTPSAPPVISILPQHTPFRSFGEGSPQFEPSSPAPIPPRTASLIMNTSGSSLGDSSNQQPRRPISFNPETLPRHDHRAHTRMPSHPVNSTHHYNNNHNNSCRSSLTVPDTIPVTSTSRLVVKTPAYVSSSPLSTSPPLTVPARTDSKPKQSVAVQQQQQSLQKKASKDMTSVSITPRIGPKAVTISTAPPNPKPAKASTMPLSPKAHDHNRRIPAGQKTPSYVTDFMSGISNFTINLQTSSLVSSASPHPLSPTESFDDSRKQMYPHSIISLLNQTQVQPQQKHQPSNVLKSIPGVFAQQQQYPDRFVVTIKVVVNAHMIIALKIQEEEANFMLSVHDLRLRVLNKLRRMSMAIPDKFDLVWVGGDGVQVVLRNDEEIQKALKGSVNNKLTVRCVF